MRILVCGSREWADTESPIAELGKLLDTPGPHVVIHGGCGREVDGGKRVGADVIAGWVAGFMGAHVEAYPIDRKLDGGWPSAGPRRNARMLRKGKPERGLAFGALWKPNTRPMTALERSLFGADANVIGWRATGTGGMVRLMLDAGLPVRWVVVPGADAVDLTEMPRPESQ